MKNFSLLLQCRPAVFFELMRSFEGYAGEHGTRIDVSLLAPMRRIPHLKPRKPRWDGSSDVQLLTPEPSYAEYQEEPALDLNSSSCTLEIWRWEPFCSFQIHAIARSPESIEVGAAPLPNHQYNQAAVGEVWQMIVDYLNQQAVVRAEVDKQAEQPPKERAASAESKKSNNEEQPKRELLASNKWLIKKYFDEKRSLSELKDEWLKKREELDMKTPPLNPMKSMTTMIGEERKRRNDRQE